VRQAVQEGVHESPTDSRPPSSASHSDADQLEVPSQPCLVEGEALPERRTGMSSERARSVLPSTDPVRST
jgi:hypothetical protein